MVGPSRWRQSVSEAPTRALELAVEYVRARQQFGRPVGSFQAVQHLAAEAAAAIEPARALLWHAGWAFDSRPREAPLAAAMAKAACAEVFRAVSRTAIEMFGGIGFTFENDMHLYFKRALANATAFGDVSFHRERVAQLAGFVTIRRESLRDALDAPEPLEGGPLRARCRAG